MSLDHLPISMMVKVGTSARYIHIAAPDQMERVPMCSGLEMVSIFPSTKIVFCRNLDR